mgnify:CR=1 FL=1|jgi:hypothetical protein
MKLVWSKFAKIKKIQKIPAQKSPTRFSSMDKQSLADKAARKKFGEGTDYITKQGMQTVSIRELAAEGYAGKVRDRVYLKNIVKGLKASRLKTAAGIKGLKAKGIKVPKASIFKAKNKGAIKTMKIAETKSTKAKNIITERYTGKTTKNIFRKSIKAPSKKPYSLETREVQFLKDLKKDMGF